MATFDAEKLIAALEGVAAKHGASAETVKVSPIVMRFTSLESESEVNVGDLGTDAALLHDETVAELAESRNESPRVFLARLRAAEAQRPPKLR